MRKRTEFEHAINSRGSKPRDYMRYVEFESNLDKLRAKKYKRLSSAGLIDTKPSISDWAGERRILFVYSRAVRKFPNDLQLWDNYLNFAKSKKSFKKIYKIYNELLQLHPTSVNSWISAANFEFETVGSAQNARVLFQKALRFNKDSKRLWLTYTIFELTYISKLLNRRKLLGLMTEKQQLEHEKSEQSAIKAKLEANGAGDEDDDDNIIRLGAFTNDEIKDSLNTLPEADINMLGNPETNPALKGDIALTIFDICMKTLTDLHKSTLKSTFEFQYELSLQFLDIFNKFDDLDKIYLKNHVIKYLLSNYSNKIKVLYLDITLLLKSIDINDEHFNNYLQLSTKKYLKYKQNLKADDEKLKIKQLYQEFLTENFIKNNTNEKLTQILNSIIKKL